MALTRVVRDPVIADMPASLRRADVKSSCVCKAPASEKAKVLSWCHAGVTPISRIWLLGSGFSDLASSLLRVDRLDGGFEGVIIGAAVVIPMSRVLMVADIDCEATGSSQSPDTRIARSVSSCLVSSRAVFVESRFDGN